MKPIKWKVALGSRVLDLGTKVAESERLVLDELLNGELGKFPVVADRSYTLQAGDLLASAYGDEFQRVREAHVMDETKVDASGGHLFAPPVVAGLPCAHPSMNRDVVGDDGMLYPACDSCDYVADKPARRALFSERYKAGKVRKMTEEELQSQADAVTSPWDLIDPDRAREDRELAKAIEKAAADGDLDPASARDLLKGIVQGVARATVRKLAEEALRKALEAKPVLGPRCASPSDHKVVEHRREEVQGTSYYCRVCDGHFLLADVDSVLRRVPWSEAEIRERLSR